MLYLTASDYQRVKPFSDLFGVTSQQVLRDYPDVQALADLELDTLAHQLQQLANGSLPQPDNNAKKLHQVAADSYPLPDHLQAVLYPILTFTLDHIRFLTDQQKPYQHLIEQHLALLPEAQDLLDTAGLGPILVAGFLAEIQDTHRFTTGQKFDRKRKQYRPRSYRDGQAAVAKLAGLWWPQNDSSRATDQRKGLARERNPYLRYWFVQAAHTLQRYQPTYAAFYQLKFQQAAHHHHKRALILTARKAVRLVFALLHKAQRDLPKEVPFS